MKTELKSRTLAATLTWTWAFFPANAQAQTQIRASPSGTPSTGPAATSRPKEMPCLITRESRLGANKTRITYRLYYRRDGRLGLATKKVDLTSCRISPCAEFPGSEEVVVRYEYNTAGRLAEVKHFDKNEEGHTDVDRLSVTYSASGRPERYSFVGASDKRYAKRGQTTIAYDGYGIPAAATQNGKMWMAGVHKTQITSTLEECRQPFSTNPVVWPFDGQTVYLGWSKRFDLMKIQGINDGKPGVLEETFTYDPDGRIRTRSAMLNGYKSDLDTWRFVFECKGERPAEEVKLETE